VKIKFNKTGTQIRKGKLYIRLDLYPDSSYKTYIQQYIDVFVRKLTEEEENNKELRKLVPTKKQLNPFLCHFISIDPDATKQQLINYIKGIFDKETLDKLDNILSVDNRRSELGKVLKNKVGGTDPKIKLEKSDKEKVNNALFDCVVII
jgi:DNA primase catalytic subunit